MLTELTQFVCQANSAPALRLSPGDLRDVGDGSRWRCLHGKADTTVSCECTCAVVSVQCAGCMVYGPSANSCLVSRERSVLFLVYLNVYSVQIRYV